MQLVCAVCSIRACPGQVKIADAAALGAAMLTGLRTLTPP